MVVFFLRDKVYSFFLDTRAAMLPMAALMIPLLLGLGGLGVDTGVWMLTHRNLQNAADAAVLSAAREIDNGYVATYEESALREAERNGYISGRAGSDITLARSVTEDGYQRIDATLTMEAPLWLAGFIFQGDVQLASAAASAIIEPTGAFCILSLSDDADGALTAVGNAEINANGCGLAVNSDSESAMDFTGSVVVDVGDVSIVGEAEVASSVEFDYTSLRTSANAIPDPYTELEPPPVAACGTNSVTKVVGSANLTPGRFCGGLTISGNGTVNFAPGIYYIDGGDFKVTGNGALIGDGVTFVLTRSGVSTNYANLNISGGKTVTFSAPGEGEDMAGVVVYQDRNAPASSSGNTFTGTSAINIDGVIYTPTRSIDFGGNNAVNSETCTKIIADTIKLHGTPGIGNNCEGNDAVMDIGSPNVRLVY